MLYTKKMKIKNWCINLTALIAFYGLCKAQSNNLSSSPYSLFGLGVDNNFNSGLANGTSGAGLAWNTNSFYNGLNPATLGSLSENIFILDVGFSAELNKISNKDYNETFFSGNLASIGLATKISNRSGISIALRPTSSVGYSLLGQTNTIEGSYEEYHTNVNGSGHINELQLSYGYSLSNKLNLGLTGSVFFGKIDESEYIEIDNSYLFIQEAHYYSGLGLSAGLTYTIISHLTFGATLELPTFLNGKKDRSITRINDSASSNVLDEKNVEIDDFELPLNLAFGLNYKYKDFYYFDFDFHKKFWSDTGQVDAIGEYKDQSIFNFGFRYLNQESLKYWQRVSLSLGLKYDTGYLRIQGDNISDFSASIGLGIPIGRSSYINFSFSKGVLGESSSLLLQENYNLLKINISLSDLWYNQRKYD